MIIANATDATVSRAQVLVELKSLTVVRLTNLSRNRAIAIRAREVLAPSDSLDCEIPVVIPLDDARAIVVQSDD